MSLKRLMPLCLLLGALPAQAQEAAVPPRREVDESALRYYAGHNEMDYYEAEVRRLRSLYPDWTPPAEPAAMVSQDDPEEPLWALFAKDDVDGLDKAAAALKAESPGWTMSDDLSRKLALKKARRTLIAASDAGNGAEVLRLAAVEPDLGGCADLEAAWRIAAAESATGARDAALARYRGLLTGCDDPAGRSATVEKALAALRPASMRPLLALANLDADASARLGTALTRAEIAAHLQDSAAPDPAPADLAAFTAAAQAASAPDAQLVGWYLHGKGDFAGALESFQAASTLLGPDAPADQRAKVVEGIVLSLAGTGDREAAAVLAHDNRALSADLAKAYVDLAAERFEGVPRPKLPDADIADYATAVLDLRSAPGAEAIGWYAYDFRQWQTAARWFDASLSWEAKEGATRGAVLAAAAAGRKADADTLLARWEADFPDMAADMRTAMAAQKPGKAAKPRGGEGADALAARFKRGDYAGCVALARKLGHLRASQEETLGWCLLKLDRPSEAAERFAAAAAGSTKATARQNALYGHSLALLAAGDTRGAVEAAGSDPMTAKRRAEIGVAALAEEAIAAFGRQDWRRVLALLDERQRHAPETMDLTMMRGWSRYHAGDAAQAEAIFAALDRVVSTPETRKGLAAVRERAARTN